VKWYREEQLHFKTTVGLQFQCMEDIRDGVAGLCKNFRLDCMRSKALTPVETPMNIREVNASRSYTRRREPSPDPKRSRRSSPDRVARVLSWREREDRDRDRDRGRQRLGVLSSPPGRFQDRRRSREGPTASKRDRERKAERARHRDERDKGKERKVSKRRGEERGKDEKERGRGERKAAQKATREESESGDEYSDEWSCSSGSSESSIHSPSLRPQPPALTPGLPRTRSRTRSGSARRDAQTEGDAPAPITPGLTGAVPVARPPPPKTPPLEIPPRAGEPNKQVSSPDTSGLAEEERNDRKVVETRGLQELGELLSTEKHKRLALVVQEQGRTVGPAIDELVKQESSARVCVETETVQRLGKLLVMERLDGVCQSESSSRSKIELESIRERAGFVEQLESSSRAHLEQGAQQAVLINGLQAMRQLVKDIKEVEMPVRRLGNWKAARVLTERRASVMRRFNGSLADAIAAGNIRSDDPEYQPYDFERKKEQ